MLGLLLCDTLGFASVTYLFVWFIVAGGAVWLYVNSVVVAAITHPLFASFLGFYVWFGCLLVLGLAVVVRLVLCLCCFGTGCYGLWL